MVFVFDEVVASAKHPTLWLDPFDWEIFYILTKRVKAVVGYFFAFVLPLS